MALNKVFLAGRLVRDPEVRDTHGGSDLCKFTIACDKRVKNKDTGERKADFIRCTAWDYNALFASQRLHKGDAVVVEGRLENDDYVDGKGIERHELAVVVEAVRFQDPDSIYAAPSTEDFDSLYDML